MSTRKNKIRKLTEKQYDEYVATLRNDAALYSPAGEITLPDSLKKSKTENERSE